MSFIVEKVKSLKCKQCQHVIDVSAHKALSTINCPECNAENVVAVTLESFLIIGVVGKGTSGMIYRAWDETNQREVAIKVFTNTEEEGSKRVEQAIGEARALVEVRHPNVVQVYAIGTTKGAPYVVMELLDGGSLKDLIVDDQFVPEEQALDYAIDIAEALYRTYQRGLLHLDVKPGNILFDKKGTPKLLDFGYASVNTKDKQSEILGTPYYVSPELVRQLPADHLCDIYSLGATLFHILTGQAPFEGETIREICLKRLNNKAPDIRTYKKDISEPTAKAIARMLEEDAADRPQTYDDLLSDLRHARLALDMGSSHLWEDEEEPTPKHIAAKTQLIKPVNQGIPQWLVIILTLTLVGAGAGFLYYMWGGPVEEPRTPPNTQNTTTNNNTNTTPPPPPADTPKDDTPTIIRIDASDYSGGDKPQNVYDNNLSTKWSAEGKDASISFALSQVAEISSIQIAWNRGSERQYIFELQDSVDGLTWSTFHKDSSSGTTAGFEIYRFEPIHTKYFRIVTHGSNINLWNYISEIKISELKYNPQP